MSDFRLLEGGTPRALEDAAMTLRALESYAPPAADLTYVDHGEFQTAKGGSMSLVLPATGISVQPGSLLVVAATLQGVVGSAGTSFLQITDDIGDTGGGAWTQQVDSSNGSIVVSQYARRADIWTRIIGTTPGVNKTVTVTGNLPGGTSTSNGHEWFNLVEIHGQAVIPIGAVANPTAGVAGAATRTFTMSGNPLDTSLVVSLLYQDYIPAGAVATPPTGFTGLQNDNGGSFQDNPNTAILTADGATTHTWTGCDPASVFTFGGAIEILAAPAGPLANGVAAHYDASDDASFTYSSGVSVSQWNDLSGNARHLTALSSGDEPDRNATLNGRTAVHFDGAAWMAANSYTPPAQPYTIQMAVRSDVNQSDKWFNGDEAQIGRHSFFGADAIVFNAGSPVAYSGYNGTDVHIITAVFNGASSVQRINGTQVGTAATGTNPIGHLWIGKPTGKPLMDMGELVFYDRVLSPAEIAQNESYLTAKWIPSFSPPSVPNLYFWLDADDPAKFTYSGGRNIATWADSYSSGQTWSTVGTAPTRETFVINGHAVARFAQSPMLWTGTAVLTGVAQTMFVLVWFPSYQSYSNGRVISEAVAVGIDDWGGSGQGFAFNRENGGTNWPSGYRGSTQLSSAGSDMSGQWLACVLTFNGSTSQMSVIDALGVQHDFAAAPSAFTFNVARIALGGRADTISQDLWSQGDIQTIGSYSRALTTTERNALLAWMYTRIAPPAWEYDFGILGAPTGWTKVSGTGNLVVTGGALTSDAPFFAIDARDDAPIATNDFTIRAEMVRVSDDGDNLMFWFMGPADRSTYRAIALNDDGTVWLNNQGGGRQTSGSAWWTPLGGAPALGVPFVVEIHYSAGNVTVSVAGILIRTDTFNSGGGIGAETGFYGGLSLNAKAGLRKWRYADNAVAPATVPDAPSNVTATPGNAQVLLAWTAPASNGAAITDYVVQWALDSAPTSWTTFSEGVSTVTSTTVTGLTNDTAYIFRVAAVNSVGTGGYSTTSPVIPTASSGALIDTFNRANSDYIVQFGPSYDRVGLDNWTFAGVLNNEAADIGSGTAYRVGYLRNDFASVDPTKVYAEIDYYTTSGETAGPIICHDGRMDLNGGYNIWVQPWNAYCQLTRLGTVVATFPAAVIDPARWCRLRIRRDGADIHVSVDGTEVGVWTDPSPLTGSRIGFGFYNGAVRMDNWAGGDVPTVYSDDFNRADSTPTGGGLLGVGLGSGWNAPPWMIQSNTARRAPAGGAYDYGVFQHDLGSLDHWAETTVVLGPANGWYTVLNARAVAANDGQVYMVFVAPDNRFVIGKNTSAGGYADLYSQSGWSNANGQKLRIEVSGANPTTIKGYVNDVLIKTVTDSASALQVAGRTYVGLNANDGSVDNYRCGPLPYTSFTP